MLENRGYNEIIGSSNAPYLNSLARDGVSFTAAHAITHPSQPNYIALFSGSTHGVIGDACPQTIHADNLGHQLLAAGLGFAGYAEALPHAGDPTCTAGAYARKHSPWVDFPDIPASANRPFSAFPRAYQRLPAVSFVIPDLQHDMHDGTIRQADDWLKAKLGSYARWARANNSLLVLTWDEDDKTEHNRIPTIVYGGGVRAGPSSQPIDQYSLLRTLEEAFGLPALGAARAARPITGIWG